jgi:chromosome segregation ATPase
MTAEYASLEARVSELEHQVRYTLPTKIDAVSYGVSLVHADTQAIRADLDELRAGQARQGTQLERHSAMLDQHGQQLERMNQRLDGHGQQLERMNERLERQDTRLARQDERLERHGELLEQILHRLPEPPA